MSYLVAIPVQSEKSGLRQDFLDAKLRMWIEIPDQNPHPVEATLTRNMSTTWGTKIRARISGDVVSISATLGGKAKSCQRTLKIGLLGST